ncbi:MULTISPECIES: Kelch repeat-containing protein [Saccharibacillus]|uniref:Kelch repeat-containing protein n=1 Tax=Saccharibacillus TaxID=456492 RepID=UPI001F2F2096|nr:kelch repeat-containing protein [Saccharibacillus sp. WB 17]
MKKSMHMVLAVLMILFVVLPGNVHAAEEGWVAKANLLKVKDRMSLVGINGKIYAIGGMSGGALLNTIDEYDVKTDTWIAKTTFPEFAKANSSSVVVDGKIYITGGIKESGTLTKSLDIYDPAANKWTKGADLPVTLAGHASEVINGKIIIAGGFTEFTNAVSTTYEYNIATNVWSAKAKMSQARRYTSSALINGKIYVVGGIYSSDGILSSVEEYDPATDVWTKKANLPKGKSSIATTSFNGLLYAIGGATASASISGPATTAVDVYNPQTDTWTTGPALKLARHSIASTVLDNKLYVAGGSNNSNYYSNFEMLDLTSTLPPVIEPPITPPGTGGPTQPSNPELVGDRAILVVTMVNGLEKEYDLSLPEVTTFINWYDKKDGGSGPSRFVIDKHFNNKGPFSKRTDSVIFNQILTFEVSEYTISQTKAPIQ